MAGFTQRKSDKVFFILKIMGVKKVFIGTCESELFIQFNKIENLLYIEIDDTDNEGQYSNALLDYVTAIEFRNELNRFLEIMENNQL
jgi:hypothetical protein